MRPLVSYGVLLAGLVGLVADIGLFTFDYGEGLSYFSTDPRACANCHIMNDQYASWLKGPLRVFTRDPAFPARIVTCLIPAKER